MLRLAIPLLAGTAAFAEPFHDRTHYSKVFGENRHYRLLLPPSYDSGAERYPVIYYHHGHSDRYTLEHYDGGKDTIPRIAAFVAANDVIVVSVDGYVASHYTGFYGGSPWDVRRDGGDYDFGAYFGELVAHIDGAYRTRASRRFRAISGLSMGGFMSLWLSARYPHLIGSASAFNPGPEFHGGDKARRVLWRPKDHVSNHTRTMVRLVRSSGDYISQYHEETREAYARAAGVDFEYRRDEYHRHWATSIEETFAFHKRAFENPSLDSVPEVWSHANPYRRFDVWGWQVEAAGVEPGITHLDNVSSGGLRITTRRYAPDGPPVPGRAISVVTAPLYSPGNDYELLDYHFSTGRVSRSRLPADARGRLRFAVDGDGHQLSFHGPGAGSQPPVLLPVTPRDRLRVPPDLEVHIPLRIYNPRRETMTDLRLALSSEYPTVSILAAQATIPRLEPGGVALDVSPRLTVRFTSGDGYLAPARLLLRITDDGGHTAAESIDVLVIPSVLPKPLAAEILDGRTMTFPVFRQKGNQGGGAPVERTVTEGKGNGNGILEPGEDATIWVKLAQGLDPFDKNTWRRSKVYSDSPYLVEIDDIQEQKQLEWTSAQERTSLVRLAADTPPRTMIPLLLDNESWSFHFTPDVRYGSERLYQAFQLHRRHLHEYSLGVP